MPRELELGSTVRWQGGLYVLVGRYRAAGDQRWARAKIRAIHDETVATADEDAEVPYDELTKVRNMDAAMRRVL